MHSKLFLLLLSVLFTTNLWAKSHCDLHVEKVIDEMKEWEKYGMRRDGRRVHFPSKCTPLMRARKMIPLPKRLTGDVNRVRYFGNDCNIYEWDSEGGLFEFYTPNSSMTEYSHKGEISAINSTQFPSKKKSARDHLAGDTGIPGYDMKGLCKDHKKGKLQASTFEKNSKVKNSLKCL